MKDHEHEHEDGEEYVHLFDLADAIEAVIKASDPSLKAALQKTIEGYHLSNGEDFHWMISDRAPALVSVLFRAIDVASMPEQGAKPRRPAGKHHH